MSKQNILHPTSTELSQTALSTTDNEATISLLEQWAQEDATSDPALIREAEQELAEFKMAMNANRPPDRPVFP